MNKDENIEYWIKSAEVDWITVHSLYAAKRYLHSVFFGHLTLEKILKALRVKNNENNIPPKIHNLVKILNDTKINLPDEVIKQLYELNTFQLEGRYPDYLFEISKRCNNDFTNEIIQNIGKMRMFTQESVIEKVTLFIDELLKSGVSIDKAYLFGSYSKGNQRVDSDIDLALVSEMFSGFGYEDRKLLSGINIKKEYIDIEPKTFSLKNFLLGNPFIDEILKTGIEINCK